MADFPEWDKQLLLWLNGFHSPWLDNVMFVITHTTFWIPLFLFLAYLIFKKFGKEGWLVLAGAALTILLADRVTSGLMKPYFARLRPSHEPALQSLIHIVREYRGGLHGFASSHAANTFGIALFLWLVFRNTYRGMIWMFLWAAIMSYSRIYLGVHYPGDILAGMCFGLLSGWAGYLFYRWLKKKREQNLAT